MGILSTTDTHKKFLPGGGESCMTDIDILYDIYHDLNSDSFNNLLPSLASGVSNLSEIRDSGSDSCSPTIRLQFVETESEGCVTEDGIYIPLSYWQDMSPAEFRYWLFRQILIWRQVDSEQMIFLCHYYLWR